MLDSLFIHILSYAHFFFLVLYLYLVDQLDISISWAGHFVQILYIGLVGFGVTALHIILIFHL